MKILHILSSNKYSGAENVACKIIECFNNEIDMAYCSPFGSIEEKLKNKGITYFGISKFNIKELKKVIKIYKPDIIYAHDFKASILSAFLGFRKKIISHIHKNDPQMKKISLKSVIYRIVSPKFYKVVGVSNSIIEEYIFKKSIVDKFVVLYNYIDIKYVIEQSKKIKLKEKYDLCYIGRLKEEKNPLEFIEICKRINDIMPIEAIIIGDGNLYEECLKKVKEYKLEKKVKFLGFLENPYPYIKASDICIMPSKYEGFGITAVESLILDKVVLNSGVGGLSDVFSESPEFICKNIDDYVKKICSIKEKKITYVKNDVFYKCTSEIDYKKSFLNIID